MTILVILVSKSLSSQLNLIVLDSISNKPIPYVNIWVADQNVSAMTNENGLFYLPTIFGNKIVVFSAVGYETKKVNINEITNSILLSPQTVHLKEVTVFGRTKKRRLTKSIGKIQYRKLGYYIPGFKEAWIFAKYFKYNESYKKTPYLKEIYLATNSDIEGAKFKVRLYSINNDGEPEGYIYPKNIIIETKKGKRITKIDLAQLNILFPKEGFFIGVEWILTESNIGKWGTFQPEIGLTQLETDIDSWYYRFGSWRKIWKLSFNEKYRDKYNHLALKLVLGN